MTILHKCSNPGCGRQMNVANEFAGMMVRCTGCGKLETVQSLAPPAGKVTPQVLANGQAGTSPLDELGIAADFDEGPDVSLDELADEAIASQVSQAPAPPQPVGPEATAEPTAPPQPAAQPAQGRAGSYVPQMPMEMPPAGSDAQDALGTRTTMWTIFVLGMIGICAGFAIGLYYSGTFGVLGAYIGAGLGWLAGLAYGLVMALGMEKSPAEKRSAIVTCNQCGAIFTTSLSNCPQCGQSRPQTVSEAAMSEYLNAMTYGLSNVQSIVQLIGLFFIAQFIWVVLTEIIPLQVELSALAVLSMKAAAVLVHVLVVGYTLRFMQMVTSRSLIGASQMPDLPPLKPFSSLTTIFRSLGVLLVYVAPAVTIPMLPLGLLALAYTNNARSYNVFWAGRSAMKRSRDLGILWLMLLVWSAAMALVLAVVSLGVFRLKILTECGDNIEGQLVEAGVSAFSGAILSAVAVIFGASLFRCIGIFARANSSVLSSLPAMSIRIRLIISLAIAITLSGIATIVLI